MLYTSLTSRQKLEYDHTSVLKKSKRFEKVNLSDYKAELGLGFIGSWLAMPNSRSIFSASLSKAASPLGGPTICNPIGSPFCVKPHGNDRVGSEVTVIA